LRGVEKVDHASGITFDLQCRVPKSDRRIPKSELAKHGMELTYDVSLQEAADICTKDASYISQEQQRSILYLNLFLHFFYVQNMTTSFPITVYGCSNTRILLIHMYKSLS
jgi:hypothetical protein